MGDGLDDLYREVILEHYRSPRNRGELEGEGARTVELQNPTCGDEIHLSLQIADGVVRDARWSGRGCSISMASASMMTEAVKGKSVEDALRLHRAFKEMLRSGSPPEGLGDLEALSGVAQFPVRVKCATLSWNAMVRALGGDANAAGGAVAERDLGAGPPI